MSYKLMDVPADCTSWEYYSLFYIQLPHFKCRHCGATESQRFPKPKPIEQIYKGKKASKEIEATEKFHREARLYLRKKDLYRGH